MLRTHNDRLEDKCLDCGHERRDHMYHNSETGDLEFYGACKSCKCFGGRFKIEQSMSDKEVKKDAN